MPLNAYPTDALAQIIIDAALQPGERDVVLINGPQSAGPLVTSLFGNCIERLARPVVRTASGMPEFTELSLDGEEAVRVINPLNVEQGSRLSAIIDIRVQEASSQPADLSTLPGGGQTLAEAAGRSWAFLHETERRGLKWIGIHYPNPEALPALEAAIPGYLDHIVRAGMLDVPDPMRAWTDLGAAQLRLCEALSASEEIRFVADGTDLSMRIAGRRWSSLDGRRINVPGGEVLSAPHEDSANGYVTFDFPIRYYGHCIEGAKLVFRDGLVVEASAQTNEAALITLLDTDTGSRRIGEVALGTNYALRSPVHNTLLDEKIGGTFHIALGMSYPETGGRNESFVHSDMICDLRNGGRCILDGQTISENGVFLNAEWPRYI